MAIFLGAAVLLGGFSRNPSAHREQRPRPAAIIV
jgi:hypothetical protein